MALRIQTPAPSPGVYFPITRSGRDNFGYDIAGVKLRPVNTLQGSTRLLGPRLLGVDEDNGGDCGCRREIASVWGFITLVAVGALGYYLGSSSD